MPQNYRYVPLSAKQRELGDAGGIGLSKDWQTLNAPLVNIPEIAEEDDDSTLTRYAKRGVNMAGQFASGFTSPMALGSVALTGGGALAGRAGLLGIGRASRAAEMALNIPSIAHGAYTAATANSLPEAAGGVLEAGLGTWGATSGLDTAGYTPVRYGKDEKFGRALRANASGESLTDSAPQALYQRRSGDPVYYGVNTTDAGERDLTSVMNNSTQRGVLAGIMADADKRGVTTLDAWAVPSKAMPDGMLPTLYRRYGWEEVSRQPYDMKYGEPSDALKRAWSQQGWTDGDPIPDVVYMRRAKGAPIGGAAQSTRTLAQSEPMPARASQLDAPDAISPAYSTTPPAVPRSALSSTAMALVGPAAAVGVPDDPESDLDDYLRIALVAGSGASLATAGAGGFIKKMSLVHPGAFRQNKLSVPTYERIAKLLDRIGNPKGTTLDFGSGTGSGADVLRSRGGIVETLEPFPAANATAPTFTGPTDIPDNTYDKIVAHDVLSGLSPRYRKEAVQDIADKLAYGGVAVISVDKKPAGMRLSVYNAGKELSEVGGRVFADGSYHKEMTTPELMEFVKNELGNGYSVEPAAGIGGAAVVLRRGPAPVIDTVKKAKDAADRAAEKIRINALVANSPVEYDDAGQLIVSNRILTAKNAPTPAAGSALMTNMDVVMQDLNLAKKMADLIRSYPQIKSSMRGLSDRGVLQAMTEMGAENLTWLWNKLPKEYRDISRNWYVGANKLSRNIAKEAQVSIDQSSALLAILSPTKDWNQNVELGKIVGRRWRAYQSSDDVFTPAMMDEYFKNSKQSLDASLKTRAKDVTPRGAAAARDSLQENLRLDSAQYLNKKWSDLDLRGKARMMRAHSSLADPQVYNIYAPTGDVSMVAKTGIGTKDEKLSSLVWQSYPILEKALSVLDDGSVQNISRQLGREHKVRAFFNNINAPSYAGASTADTHQVGASLIMPVGTKSPEVKATMGGMGSASTGVSGINPLWQESLTLAAMNAGANPRDIIPREMQSVSWDAIKALFSPAQKRDTSPTGLPAQARRLWLEHQRGLLTADQVREEIYMLATGGNQLQPGWVTGIQDLEDEGF